MAVVLAIVIIGWLGAFVLAAKDGFENAPSITAVPSSAVASTAVSSGVNK